MIPHSLTRSRSWSFSPTWVQGMAFQGTVMPQSRSRYLKLSLSILAEGSSLVKLSSPLLLTPGLSGTWHMTSIRAPSIPYPSPMVGMNPSILVALILRVK